MKAALYKGPNKIVIEDIDTPQPGNGEIQVKVHSTGICGTDLHLYQGYKVGPWKIDLDRVFGHEFGGIITKLGNNVPENFKVGDRVRVSDVAPGAPEKLLGAKGKVIQVTVIFKTGKSGQKQWYDVEFDEGVQEDKVYESWLEAI